MVFSCVVRSLSLWADVRRQSEGGGFDAVQLSNVRGYSNVDQTKLLTWVIQEAVNLSSALRDSRISVLAQVNTEARDRSCHQV